MNGHNVAYIRVSSVDQNTARQLDGLDNIDRTFEDKISAKDRYRPQLQECLEYLREGDQLHVHSIDRLARNLLDLQPTGWTTHRARYHHQVPQRKSHIQWW